MQRLLRDSFRPPQEYFKTTLVDLKTNLGLVGYLITTSRLLQDYNKTTPRMLLHYFWTFQRIPRKLLDYSLDGLLVGRNLVIIQERGLFLGNWVL